MMLIPCWRWFRNRGARRYSLILNRLAMVVGQKKFVCVEKARRCFSMCNHLRMISRLCTGNTSCYLDPAQGPS